MAQKGNTNDKTQNGDPMAEAREIIEAEVKTLRPAQRAFLELLSWLENQATEDTESNAFTGDDIAAILMAEDETAMWEADSLPRFNAKVLSGAELELFGIEVKFSDSPDIVTGLIGPTSRRKMYLLIRAARLSTAQKDKMYLLPKVGEEFTWNTSARFIVAKLYWLAVRGRFDNGKTVKAYIDGTDLGEGKSVEKLKLLTAPVLESAPEEVPF